MSIEIYQTLLKEVYQLNTLADQKPKDYETIDQFKQWLLSVERYLQKNQIDDFRRIAEIRGKLIASQVAFDRRVPKLKRQLSATSELISLSKQTMSEIIHPLERRYQDPKKQINKMLLIAEHQGLLQWNNGLRFRDFVHALWRVFKKEEKFKTHLSKTLKTVSDDEAIALLAEEVRSFIN